MRTFKPDSWKSKIDPDFDKAIITLLSCIRKIRDASDKNYFVVKDEALEPILNVPGWQTLYDGKEWQNLIDGINEMIKEGITPENLLDERLPRKQKAMKRWLILKTKGLSESSQKYYARGITSFFNGTLLKSYWGLTEIKKQKAIRNNQKELGAVFLALLCRILIQDLKDYLDSSEEGDDILNAPELLNDMMSVIYSMLAQIAFQESMYELLKKGDDESLLKAITIDKTIICTDVLKKRILKASLSGDSDFLKKLGRAISKGSVSKEALHYETYMVLRYFWLVGLCKLKVEDLYYFLKSCGINPPRYPYAFERFLIRHIHPLYKGHVNLALP